MPGFGKQTFATISASCFWFSGEYPSLANYAGDLAERGLATLADHDQKAGAIFDLSWKTLEEDERELFAAASLFPGGDFGVNFARARLDCEQREPAAQSAGCAPATCGTPSANAADNAAPSSRRCVRSRATPV